MYTLSRTIADSEVLSLAWAGTADGLEDAAGNDLAAFSGLSVLNGSSIAFRNLSLSIGVRL